MIDTTKDSLIACKENASHRIKLVNMQLSQIDTAIEIIESAREHLKEQGVDQWQDGYPNYERLKQDAISQIGYFVVDNNAILGYISIDFGGEPAYDNIEGSWQKNENYVVVHRMALRKQARGQNISSLILKEVEKMSLQQGVRYFRIDTGDDNPKMKHILAKSGFTYRGVVWYDANRRIALDKSF